MSVLVNGSPTKEFVVERGLRKGDPLSPFIFVIVAEALKGMVSKVAEIGEYVGFNIRRKCSVDILQFVDDTLSIGKGRWKQVWAIKAIPRGFEMVSGLGINYHKSKIIGFNVSDNFLDIASNFLSCRREDNNFTFLGIPIGINPRRISSWNVILNKLKSRLLDWKVRLLSFGGRLTLLKSVLCSLSIFMLSFYNAPKKVLMEISRLQSNFLWGGVGENKKIHWWRWRILGGSKDLWYRVFRARYEDINLHVVSYNSKVDKKFSKSTWWTDILSLENSYNENLFVDNCRFFIGNGYNTSFWQSRWMGDFCLKVLFPVAYNLSEFKFVSVASMGGWRGDVWF
ncbi:uncharacterized protein LOC131619194 [Vicia villosa]|uniref:uncharacterized protein LOC131619194 n=1 Tax=Vicia villosa TaxID=3911 RepID=UPI00273C6A6A|nr:uncharacterized protein LOC131619194 [Vicia villosa]